MRDVQLGVRLTTRHFRRFVNLSPADYNAEETQTSLVYASRVKLITNSAEKMAGASAAFFVECIYRLLFLLAPATQSPLKWPA